ncbi:hypothetical protein SLE2022_198440 [Rubroshorea leprosula]
MSQIQAAFNGSWVCQSQNYAKTRGIFFGGNPFRHPTTVILAQLSLASLFTAFFQLLFNPLGESGFFSQMIVGILIGPSLLGSHLNSFRNAIFPLRSVYVSQTFSYIGCMFFLFLVGVRTDLSMIKKSGKKAVVIGFLTYVLPICLNLILAAIINNKFDLEPTLKKSVFVIAGFQGISSFHVVVCLLADLKLLNSELGRLATSSSLVSGLCSWLSIVTCFTINSNFQGKQDVLTYMNLSMGCLIILIVYILRPIILWMVKRITEEKSVKEDHIYVIFLMVLSCAFFSEVIGQQMMLGPMMLGLAVPDGPPLGSALVAKLESYVSSVLLPSYFVLSGSLVNISSIQWDTLYVVEMFALSGFAGKLLATVVPSLYCKMPLNDALCFGLVMSAQGITDVLMLHHAFYLGLINVDIYTIMSISMVLITGIMTPIIKLLYNPSKRYVSHLRRTLQHTRPDAELRMMACIYSEDQAPSIINLLELSNPTSISPICFYVVHLLELTGRSAPVLVSHRPGKNNSFQAYYSEHIINAFRMYEQQCRGFLVVNLFSAISPYATMHDEICSLAMDKRVAMVIIPFHRHWAVHGGMDELPRPVRSANRNILRSAPCSVGILIDRGTFMGTSSLSSKSLYSIGVIFAEGPDDREALAYALRMGDHPNVCITVVQLIANNKHKVSTNQSDHLDDQIINEFKITMVGKKHHTFREEAVSDSVGTVAVIRSVENCFHLILVGRRHDKESQLFLGLGLTEWNEFPELGLIGDMLASTDSNCHTSVLVVQQQTFANELIGKDKFLFKDSCVVLDIPQNSGKVWPELK